MVLLHVFLLNFEKLVWYMSAVNTVHLFFSSLGPACWLWDYLRRSGLRGFFLPLSGGLDSASVACLVGSMCTLVVDAIAEGYGHVANDLRQLLGRKETEGLPKSAKDLAK
jgi:NAD+ synthase (glutamine-hydrolysing)